MEDKENPTVLVMAIFMVTRNDVLACADELGISREELTDDVLDQVQKVVSEGMGDWHNVIRDLIKEALKDKGMNCPLDMACAPTCSFGQVGHCGVPEKVE